MPAPVKNAICGPQVPGTHKPDNMSDTGALASLNPCPLNGQLYPKKLTPTKRSSLNFGENIKMLTYTVVCCNIWGQCGNTAEFCTKSEAESKAPGTAAPGQNGCISNCGTAIVSSDPPSQPITVGYFEGFNEERVCLNMAASEIPVFSYTHLHFSFASLSDQFEVKMQGPVADQWQQFLTLSGPDITFEIGPNIPSLSGPRLILSIGGWAFSTDPKTYSVLRNAVKKENRVSFAKNIASFVSNSSIDGVDFDWEYPGAPDIPGNFLNTQTG